MYLVTWDLPWLSSQPLRGPVGFCHSAQAYNPSWGSTRPAPQRDKEVQVLILAVSTCWDPSPHKINYSAEQKVGESWEGLGREASSVTGLPGLRQSGQSCHKSKLWGTCNSWPWKGTESLAGRIKWENVCVYIYILIDVVCLYIYLNVCVHVKWLQLQLFVTLWTTRFLSPWDSPGKNSGVGCHVLLLQQIFPSQGLNPSFLYLLP